MIRYWWFRSYVSTHPSFYSTRKQAGFTYVEENRFNEFKRVNSDYAAIIGNDVWIGDDVTIIGGVTVGDGAIIGTRAVVTRDVPPHML